MKVLAVHPSPLMYTKIYLRLEPLMHQSLWLRPSAKPDTRCHSLICRSNHRDYSALAIPGGPMSWPSPAIIWRTCQSVDLAKLTKHTLPEVLCSSAAIAPRLLRSSSWSMAQERSIAFSRGKRRRSFQNSCRPSSMIVRLSHGFWRRVAFRFGAPPRFVENLDALSPARNLLRHRREIFHRRVGPLRLH